MLSNNVIYQVQPSFITKVLLIYVSDTEGI
jgi:hypothetical protein